MSEAKQFKFEGASCVLHERSPHHWFLSNLYSLEPRNGHATMVMRMVILWADKEGVKIRLKAAQFGTAHGLTTPQLIEWYKKFGFVEMGLLMERLPCTTNS